MLELIQSAGFLQMSKAMITLTLMAAGAVLLAGLVIYFKAHSFAHSSKTDWQKLIIGTWIDSFVLSTIYFSHELISTALSFDDNDLSLDGLRFRVTVFSPFISFVLYSSMALIVFRRLKLLLNWLREKE